MANENLGKRLQYARSRANLTQAVVIEQAGLDVGVSSLSEWEKGVREPAVSQLARLADVYKRSFDWFLIDTEPVENQIKWRKRPESPEDIEGRFRLFATYFHELEMLCGKKIPVSLPPPIQVGSRREAELLADSIRNDLQLGPSPGHTLRSRLEEACGVKLFCFDFDPSGTAATLCEREGIGVAVLLNQKNSIRRLAFDLAHELYHIVALGGAEEESFADAFAAQLLMPSEAFLREIDLRGNEDGKISYDAFLEVVREFGVSIEAAIWRLHNLKDRPDSTRIEPTIGRLYQVFSDSDESALVSCPPELPERYVSLAKRALYRGLISTGYYAKCLGISRNRAMAAQSKILESDGEDSI